MCRLALHTAKEQGDVFGDLNLDLMLVDQERSMTDQRYTAIHPCFCLCVVPAFNGMLVFTVGHLLSVMSHCPNQCKMSTMHTSAAMRSMQCVLHAV